VGKNVLFLHVKDDVNVPVGCGPDGSIITSEFWRKRTGFLTTEVSFQLGSLLQKPANICFILLRVDVNGLVGSGADGLASYCGALEESACEGLKEKIVREVPSPHTLFWTQLRHAKAQSRRHI
jgi:hypothetical protein